MVTTRESSTRPRLSIFGIRGYQRHERLVRTAWRNVNRGTPVREAARKASCDVSSMFYLLKRLQDKAGEARRQLSDAEERRVLFRLKGIYRRNGKVEPADLMTCVQDFIRGLPVHRKQQITFWDGVPSRAFCLSFERRHSDSFIFAMRRNYGRAWTATNARSLTTFFAQLHRVRTIYNIPADGVFCAGLSVVCPRTEVVNSVMRSVRRWNLFRSSQVPDGDICLLSVIRGDGTFRRPVVLEKDTSTAFIGLARDVGDQILGYKALEVGFGELGSCPEQDALSEEPLCNWALDLISDVAYMTQNGRRLLLLYDGVEMPFSSEALNILWEGGVVPMTVPEHAQHRTLPLRRGVSINCSLQKALGDGIVRKLQSTVTTMSSTALIKSCLEDAVDTAFTMPSITAAFRERGVEPLDEVFMFQGARPLSVEHPKKFADLSEMVEMVSDHNERTDRDLFLLSGGSHNGVVGRDSIQGGDPFHCPCKLHLSSAWVAPAPQCVHDLFGKGSLYEACTCGMHHVPHMCTGRFLFPADAISCNCSGCLRGG